MGSKSAGPGVGGDVPAFDMPPTQQVPGGVYQAAPQVAPPQMGGMPNIPVNVGMTPVAGVQPIPPGMAAPQMDPRILAMMQARQAQMGGVPANFDNRPQMSPEDTLRMLYQTQLGRQGEQGGMDYWRQQMANGMTPDQIRDVFRASQEGQAYRQQRPMQPQMAPEVLDAMRLAYERNRPQRTYTPEEWSATFGSNVEPDPRMIRQESTGQLPPNVGQALALLGRLGLAG